jgi:hypothetical protein
LAGGLFRPANLGNGHLPRSLCNATYISTSYIAMHNRTKIDQKATAIRKSLAHLPAWPIKADSSEKVAESDYR